MNVNLKTVLAITVVSAILIVSSLSIAQATVGQVDTTTSITKMFGISSLDPIAFPPSTPVSIEGQVATDEGGAPNPSDGSITLQYRPQGTTTLTTPSSIPVGSDGFFTGSFMSPANPGNYEFQAVYSGSNTASGGYHCRPTNAIVLNVRNSA